MPEVVRTFQLGKMNTDLDERLVPNGEYRDALNVQVSSSNTSDEGAVENIEGNAEVKNQTYSLATGVGTLWPSDFLPVDATCVGIIADNTTEKIYALITSSLADAIYEFDQPTQVISPILVDTANVLKFDKNRLITGINVLEGTLFFTDNQNEPKQIDINLFKNSAPNFVTHSQIYGRDFIEQDITVIKKSPLTAPSIELLTSFRDEPTNFTFSYDFLTTNSGGNIIALPVGTTITVNSNIIPNLREGDTVEITATDTDPTTGESIDIQIRLQVAADVFTTSFDMIVANQPENVPSGTLLWAADLVEPPGVFQFEFVRFAYRWKYNNNQYSTFSPFSEVAFKPGDYEWNTLKGFNLGMVNQIKKLILSGFEEPPADVTEIEILYKNDQSNSIYSVDNIKDYNTEYELDTELIFKQIEANQILRPWDNVPRYALSQEISANRLVYANYVQNYDMGFDPMPRLQVLAGSEEFGENIPKPSIKTLRTYQLGVVYQDEYGRQSPVFSSENASVALDKEYAVDQMFFNATMQSNPPSWATHFKYFIKDAAGPYYNLAMDRYYLAEDGNVWISFPSADRNKVTEETFLILKKKHSTPEPVTDEARFKIIAISNEAPLFLKIRKIQIGNSQTLDGFKDGAGVYSYLPQPDFVTFDFKKSTWDDDGLEGTETKSGLVVQFSSSNEKSDQYDIASISLVNNPDRYRIQVEGRFQDDIEDVVGTPDAPKTGVGFQIFQKKEENKPEFEGRFFVKLFRNNDLNDNILTQDNPENFSIQSVIRNVRNTRVLAYNEYDHWRYGSGGVRGGWQIDNSNVYRPGDAPDPGNGIKVGATKITISYHGEKFDGLGNTSGTSQYATFVSALKEPGAKIRFTDDPDQTVYTTTGVQLYSVRNFDKKWSSDSGWGSNKRARFDLTLDKAIVWSPEPGLPLNSRRNNQSSATTSIELLSAFTEESAFTSDNPAIFETEPKETADLDIYWEASNALPISDHGSPVQLSYFNSFNFGNGVESNRIRDDFNSPTIAKGVKASAPLDEPYEQEHRGSGLIFSQIFNSRAGINRLNQFIQALPITKDLNPLYGSIQKLYSRSKDGDLITLCEDKSLKILANKDALFEANGNAQLVSNNKVLGQAVPYNGEFGISKNPESFVQYGFRSYYTDKNRGVVLRLSGDGLEEISRYGMGDFFSDNLANTDKIIGSFDSSKGTYNLTLDLTDEWLNKTGDSKTTISFKESMNGWESRKSFIFENAVTLNNIYYSIKAGRIWQHEANSLYNNFYGVQYNSSLTLIENTEPTTVKGYKTINYAGSRAKEYFYLAEGKGNERFSIQQIQANNLTPIQQNDIDGWYVESIKTDLQEGTVDYFVNKEGKWFNNIKGIPTYFNTNADTNVDSQEFTVQGIGRANEIIAPPVTEFNVNIFVDQDCSQEILPPTADDMNYTVVEDCDPGCAILQLAALDPNTTS